MTTLFEAAMGGYNAADKMIRESRAYQAARKEYGEKAGDPGLFSALQEMDLAQNRDRRADEQLELQRRGVDRADRADARAAEVHGARMRDTSSTRDEAGLYNLVNGLRQARDNGDDLGAAFDQLVDKLPEFGVAEEDIPQLRQELLDNPAILDTYYEALGGANRGRTGRGGSKAADAEAQRAQGREDVSRTIGKMRDLYTTLDENNAIVNPGEGAMSNMGAYARTTWLGRTVEGAIGTESESARRSIEGLRPSLINAMKGAEEMGARMFDSNKDMELWLATVTDPTQDIDTVMRLLDEFEAKYGAAMDGDDVTPIKPPADRADAGDYSRADGSGKGTIYQGFRDENGNTFVGTDPNNPAHWNDKDGNPMGTAE